MNYYDPFLAAWKLGPSGKILAAESLVATTAFSVVLTAAYQAFAVPVVDVAVIFHIYDFALVPIVNVPLNVFLEIIWTWIDAYPPDSSILPTPS